MREEVAAAAQLDPLNELAGQLENRKESLRVDHPSGHGDLEVGLDIHQESAGV
ncbi:hypothetical protein SAMN05421748_13179 [Paractinoplanes atraurantiacus]|uniref:Uncharacterized protein n=1 Tax=Paractinoplanes atraurantiacus TaxID=1036182 RepID=A0A285K3Z0_9ACTN|nr:hypothetical protein [Actinoplanes atraurantiacus]SNY67302.1 hypothetical protein SAMN05421748_13179 [Actinoplanes atraurantiacus]